MIGAGCSRSSSAHHWQRPDAIQQHPGRLAIIPVVIKDSLPDCGIPGPDILVIPFDGSRTREMCVAPLEPETWARVLME